MYHLKEYQIYILSLIFLCLVFFTVETKAQNNPDEFWEVGKPVYARVLCDLEGDILEVAYADSQSRVTTTKVFRI
jgi:hypothetical protein